MKIKQFYEGILLRAILATFVIGSCYGFLRNQPVRFPYETQNPHHVFIDTFNKADKIPDIVSINKGKISVCYGNIKGKNLVFNSLRFPYDKQNPPSIRVGNYDEDKIPDIIASYPGGDIQAFYGQVKDNELIFSPKVQKFIPRKQDDKGGLVRRIKELEEGWKEFNDVFG